MPLKQLHEVCGLRPEAGAAGIFEGFAHGRSRLYHGALHARACGLGPWSSSPFGGASRCAKLVMVAEAVVDKVITLAQWLLEAAARYPTIILYRYELT